jgi:putative membrane protein insertion efficiency factor
MREAPDRQNPKGASAGGGDAGRKSRPGTAVRIAAWPLLGLVWLYRHTLSPLLGINCRFQPTCSEYATEALRRYGGIRGGYLAMKRVGRCHPWGGSGYDPVPRPRNDDSR